MAEPRPTSSGRASKSADDGVKKSESRRHRAVLDRTERCLPTWEGHAEADARDPEHSRPIRRNSGRRTAAGLAEKGEGAARSSRAGIRRASSATISRRCCGTIGRRPRRATVCANALRCCARLSAPPAKASRQSPTRSGFCRAGFFTSIWWISPLGKRRRRSTNSWPAKPCFGASYCRVLRFAASPSRPGWNWSGARWRNAAFLCWSASTACSEARTTWQLPSLPRAG